ncbi:MAG: hypothetical protein MR691_07985 [Clostridium sp.]|nr:hypothetical protein [Clostridium sp.]MCI7267776.1 hypothetical protein [Mollicutes bacterium]MDY4544808.1 hypothetical protein [Bacilli bacterium]
MEDISNIIKIISAISKDAAREQMIKKIKKANNDLVKVEAESRRIKSKEIIMQMAELDCSLYEFELEYNNIKKDFTVENKKIMDEYIKKLKEKRNNLCLEKKKLRNINY